MPATRRGADGMRGAAVILAMVLALVAPRVAQADIIDNCARDGLGLPQCPTEELAIALDRLYAGDFHRFRRAGMETFAMLTVTRHLASALRWQDGDDTNCRPAEEAHFASELWFEWVRLPAGVTEDLTAEFEKYERLLGHVVAGYSGGDC